MRVPFVDLAAQNTRIRDDILAAVSRVIDHGQFILGPEVAELEAELSSRLGHAQVVTLASGLDALVLTLQLCGVGPGDEVVVPSHTFVATALAVSLCGAQPVFADIDPHRMLLDPACVAAAVSPRTRAIIPVHLSGHPCDMAPLSEIAERHQLHLIEDCAQSLGSSMHGSPTGTVGIGCFSLHPLKPLSALGDAGFVAIRDAEQAERLRRMRNMGLVDRDHCAFVGRHSRLDTLHAAILLVKLAHFDGYIERRRAHARAYDAALVGHFVLTPVPEGANPSYSAYVVRHPDRDRIRKALIDAGFDVKVHYPIPVHRQEAYAAHPTTPLPVTHRTVKEILSLPVSPELGDDDRDRLIEALLAVA